MKTFIVLALVFAAAFATKEAPQASMDEYTGFTLAEVQQITELRETKWGNIFFTMAEMHLAADGPIQKLVTALDDLTKELTKAQDTENQKFAQKKAIHQATIQNLNSQVNEATSVINANKQKIDGVLKPRLAQAQKDIISDEKTIKDKQDFLVKIAKQREVDHNVYLDHVKQYTAYIATIDECMALINGLVKGGASLMEIRQASISIKNFEAQIRHSNFADAPFLAALVAIATSQNFANQESINKVLKMFSEFRAKVAKSLTDEGVADAADEKRYQALVAQTNKEIVERQTNIKTNTALIATTQKAIDDCNNLILIKTHEVLELKDRISKENENWRREVNVHKELIAEIKKELDVVKKCRDIFTSAQFSGYVSNKIAGKGAKAKKF